MKQLEKASDGGRLAVGERGHDGNGNDSGDTRVFEYDGAAWTQLGSDIDGEEQRRRVRWIGRAERGRRAPCRWGALATTAPAPTRATRAC